MRLDNKFIVRRTASQERFEVLWEKRMEGELTLKELTEIDEIINRDPLIFQFVLKEMENWSSPPNNDHQNIPPPTESESPLQTLTEKLKSFFRRITTFFTVEVEMA